MDHPVADCQEQVIDTERKEQAIQTDDGYSIEESAPDSCLPRGKLHADSEMVVNILYL